MTKTCNKCGFTGEFKLFIKRHDCKDGIRPICIRCYKKHRGAYLKRTGNASTHKYEKTKNGFLMRLYRNMKSRVTGVQKLKFHLYIGKELMPKQEFYDWALSNDDFHSLFKEWENSNYDLQLTPSPDRLDSGKGYIIDNMEWVTNKENSDRGRTNRWRNHD